MGSIGKVDVKKIEHVDLERDLQKHGLLTSEISRIKEEKNQRKYYTREDVAKHNKKGDCWIILNDNVYDLSKFQRIHPGGSRVISIYAGQDATVNIRT